ncbi:uncharacterized protein LOC116214800 isoform X2 [Punica granatum]|uniref:UDP-N-acetylglucosamine 1-carboxyvinyltransferase n=1 Tax=Punica granatum TaxID=22663 RepID=A0A6P8EH90_PUNGR|nr:uncharacterized protein LOC116214800 isoform X2 [Punica granatum]
MDKPLTLLNHIAPSFPVPTLHLHDQVQTLDQKLTINGPSKLSGHVHISGSKNSSLAILAATLCCSGTTKLRDVPNLSDTRAMGSILSSLSAEVEVSGDEVLINADGVSCVEPCRDRVKEIRGGFFVIGPLLARFGEAAVALPGGCDIGSRPVDLFMRGLRALGAIVELRDGKVEARVRNGRRLVAGKFRLDYPSVGATETLMMAACLADGVTILSNVAKEPEVIDLAHFLNNSGAHIEGAGSSKIRILGQSQLHGTECTITPDRIEAGTFLLAAAITRSCINISPVFPSHISSLVHKLQTAGCRIRRSGRDSLEVSAVCENGDRVFRGFNVTTSPFPGFPTDLQPQTMALLTTCNGLSRVEESVFERRMTHVQELQKLGARIDLSGSRALIYGKEKASALVGSELTAMDLRGGAALVLAGLAAEGRTEISAAGHIYRGYEDIDRKLAGLGADIQISSSTASVLA